MCCLSFNIHGLWGFLALCLLELFGIVRSGLACSNCLWWPCFGLSWQCLGPMLLTQLLWGPPWTWCPIPLLWCHKLSFTHLWETAQGSLDARLKICILTEGRVSLQVVGWCLVSSASWMGYCSRMSNGRVLTPTTINIFHELFNPFGTALDIDIFLRATPNSVPQNITF